MSLWTEEMHEEHFKDLLRASTEIRIARQEKERRRKNPKSRHNILLWLMAHLSAFIRLQ
jgi:CRISPR/Cas system-associated endonuclease Cas3-HD